MDTDEALSTTADTLGSTDSGTLANDQSDSLIGTDSDGSNYGETTSNSFSAMVRPTKAAATPWPHSAASVETDTFSESGSYAAGSFSFGSVVYTSNALATLSSQELDQSGGNGSLSGSINQGTDYLGEDFAYAAPRRT